MNEHAFELHKTACLALPSGALMLPDHAVLCVSDLHLGKAERIARRSSFLLPPYEIAATLDKLEAEITRHRPNMVICLGDSFDDLIAAQSLAENVHKRITTLKAGREWIWIEGNHDPGPVTLGGTHLSTLQIGSLHFRHIATAQTAEVSGHYHPKHRLAGVQRPSFLYDAERLIMPAFGTYTGGLSTASSAIRALFPAAYTAVLTGQKAIAVPVKPL